MTQLVLHPQRRTSPIIWAAAVILSFLAVVVIISGMIIFVGYLTLRPKMPILRVTEARLADISYSQEGVLAVQIIIIVQAQNHNMKAHATFYDTKFRLSFHGLDIAELRTDAFDVRKNFSVVLPYVVDSRQIPLEPHLQYLAEDSIREGMVLFYLKGRGKTRWKIGPLGSKKFWLHLNCELNLLLNMSAVNPHCSSNSN